MSTTESDEVFIINAMESPNDVLTDENEKQNTNENGTEIESTAFVLEQQNVPLPTSIRVFKHVGTDNDENFNCVVTFDDEFTSITGLSLASPTKAWLYNSDKAKLIDIEKGEVLLEYNASCIQGSFCHVKCLDESSILFLDSAENTISRMAVVNSTLPIVDLNTGICSRPIARINVLCFVILRTGQIITCISKTKGFLCLQREDRYIQLHSGYGNFIREVKLEHNTKNLIPQTYDMIENYNGDICIAAEKCTSGYSEYIIVLDMNLNFRFTYEGEDESVQFSSPSLAVDPSNNNILIVIQQQYISVIDPNGTFLRKLSVENLRSDGAPRKIAVDTEHKLWIVTSLNKIVCMQLHD